MGMSPPAAMEWPRPPNLVRANQSAMLASQAPLAMVSLRSREVPVAAIGAAFLAATLLAWGSNVFNLRDSIRELTLDRVLAALAPRLQEPALIVVDIDSESLARYGPWPWGRVVLAELLTKIADAKPKVVGLDILLAEPDRMSAAGILRSFGDTERADVAELAKKLPDGDAAVAQALDRAPSVLGFVLDPATATAPPPGVPILVRGRIEAPDIWQAPGAIGPLPTIAAAARGLGAIVLAGDTDGKVRRVPLLVGIDGQARPGFAVEMLRVYYEASSLILDTAQQRLRVGPLAVPLDADAALRVLPQPIEAWPERTVSAWRIITDETARARLTDRIVLVGSGAPEVGDVRETPASAVTPSV
jgi:adenylate cyclase